MKSRLYKKLEVFDKMMAENDILLRASKLSTRVYSNKQEKLIKERMQMEQELHDQYRRYQFLKDQKERGIGHRMTMPKLNYIRVGSYKEITPAVRKEGTVKFKSHHPLTVTA